MIGLFFGVVATGAFLIGVILGISDAFFCDGSPTSTSGAGRGTVSISITSTLVSGVKSSVFMNQNDAAAAMSSAAAMLATQRNGEYRASAYSTKSWD